MPKIPTILLRKFRLHLILSTAVLAITVSSNAQFRYTRNLPIIKNYTIPSQILNEKRKISIYKPEVFPEYANAVAPVIYVFDGEAYINYVASIINMICERFVQLPPINVVGIENYVDSNFSARERDFNGVNGSNLFMRFVNEEVFPFVEKDYKQRPYRVIVGHSSSADFAMRIFLKQPLLFNAYLVSSFGPTDMANIRSADSSLTVLNERKNILFLSSGNEGWAQESIQKIDSLLIHRVQKGLSYHIMEYPNDSHYSVFLKSYYDGLDYIFRLSPSRELQNPKDMTIQILEAHYKNMQEIFGFPMKPPQTVTNGYAENFLNYWNDTAKALKFFRENADNYPESQRAQVSYAEALLKNGDKKNALAIYEKALRLNPGDANLREIVNKLRSGQ